MKNKRIIGLGLGILAISSVLIGCSKTVDKPESPTERTTRRDTRRTTEKPTEKETEAGKTDEADDIMCFYGCPMSRKTLRKISEAEKYKDEMSVVRRV